MHTGDQYIIDTKRGSIALSHSLKLVLDTNVILDWLVFGDPAMSLFRQSVGEGRVVVLTHPRASDELRRVLAYPKLHLDEAQQAVVHASYRAHTVNFKPSLPADTNLPAGFPQCRDSDDQHFLVLAYQARPTALISRDKQLLRLQARAAKFGVTIVDARQLNAMLAAP